MLRPGALFLVGDPKQAIYRFRGADVSTYVRARERILARSPDDVVPISTNFRSCRSILAFVDRCFQDILAGPGQPGFAPSRRSTRTTTAAPASPPSTCPARRTGPSARRAPCGTPRRRRSPNSAPA
ncbi:UvrD-helicase domain-containing protein [Methylobacterium tardum]|uniref:UvrD-helicase domain-containing protein n=1 Tax=Methylobacterium tardum TaxID=374432 RepID=UPI00361F9428